MKGRPDWDHIVGKYILAAKSSGSYMDDSTSSLWLTMLKNMMWYRLFSSMLWVSGGHDGKKHLIQVSEDFYSKGGENKSLMIQFINFCIPIGIVQVVFRPQWR